MDMKQWDWNNGHRTTGTGYDNGKISWSSCPLTVSASLVGSNPSHLSLPAIVANDAFCLYSQPQY